MTRSSLSTPALLLIVIGAALAGGGVGFVLGGVPGNGTVLAADLAAPTIERHGDDSRDRSVDVQSLAALDAGGRTTEAVVIRSNPSLDAAAVTRAVRATSRGTTVDVPVGSGVIAGVIAAEDGAPIANVDVLLLPSRSEFRAKRKSSSATVGDEIARTLDEALRKAAKEWAEGDGLSIRTTTDASGEYAFTEVADGRYHVRAELEGWRFRMLGPGVVIPGESAPIEGRPTHHVRIALVATDGTPIDRAMLQVSGGQRHEWLEWTAGDPDVHFEHAQFTVRAYADLFDIERSRRTPFARLVSDLVAVDSAVGDTPTITLELEPRSVLFGRLSGKPSRDDGHNGVFMVALRAGETFDSAAKLNGALTGWAGDGTFIFDELQPGSYAIGMYDSETMPVNHQIIEIVDGLNEVVLERYVPDPSGCISVRALSPSGVRLDTVNYWFEYEKQGADADTTWAPTRRNVDGVDLIDIERVNDFDYDDLPAGMRLWLLASSPSYGRARVELSAGQREALIQFESPCELVVSIAGDTSIGGYLIKILDASREREDPPTVATASQGDRGGSGTRIGRSGSCRFRGLAPGPVTVVLVHTSRWWGEGVEITKQELTLSGSEHRVEFQAITLCDLSVVITPSEKDKSFSLRQEEEDGEERTIAWGSTTTDGRLTFRGLPPGDYIVVLGGKGARLDVTLPSGEIRWDLSEYVIKLTVSISKIDGQLAAWGLKGGDLITALDGEPVEDDQQLLALLDAKSVAVTVERDGETFELELDQYPRAERGKNPLGGWFYISND